MDAVFKKLQFKEHESILISRAPVEFQRHLRPMMEVTRVVTRPSGKRRYPFALYFVKTCAEIEATAPSAVARLLEDGLLWFAYPKKSSKRYPSDIGRDDSWQALGDLGFEAVRMIAIDEDWSALRVRHVDYIESMKRDAKRAMSAKGKRRLRR
jgi:hypothetical protein